MYHSCIYLASYLPLPRQPEEEENQSGNPAAQRSGLLAAGDVPGAESGDGVSATDGQQYVMERENGLSPAFGSGNDLAVPQIYLFNEASIFITFID
ncbi:hypothetical protein [Pectobacterium cacticida]|uniref:hypothetical protein n=1 Tax=Pectobacterium cacticida TaxID=69221 RepID=UPI0039862898